MGNVEDGDSDATQLEVALRLLGDVRRRLVPLKVTPLQGATLLYLSRHKEATLKATAVFFRLRAPTMVEVIKDLVRNDWVTKGLSKVHWRALSLSLTPKGRVLVGKIKDQVAAKQK